MFSAQLGQLHITGDLPFNKDFHALAEVRTRTHAAVAFIVRMLYQQVINFFFGDRFRCTHKTIIYRVFLYSQARDACVITTLMLLIAKNTVYFVSSYRENILDMLY